MSSQFRVLRATCVVCLLLLVFLSCPAMAWVVDTKGDVLMVAPPADTRIGRVESNTDLFLFSERLAFELPVDIQLDMTMPSMVPVPDDQSPDILPAGTIVNSYMVHFDPVGAPTGGMDVEGSITFSDEILGIIGRDTSLWDTDFVLGNPDTLYPRGAHSVKRRIEFNPEDASPPTADFVSLLSNRRTVSFDLHSGNSLDQARIVTASGLQSWGTFQNFDFEDAIVNPLDPNDPFLEMVLRADEAVPG